jgi:cell shape-determining protein MreC
MDLNRITRRFLLGEEKSRPSIRSYVESVVNIIESVRPKTQKESRQLSVAKEHLREIKRLNRKLEEQLYSLEEQIKLLEEGKE